MPVHILVGSFKEDNWRNKRGSKTQSFHTSEHKVPVLWDVTLCGLYTLNWETGPSETPVHLHETTPQNRVIF
jgi:hypothetical protein